MSNNKYTVVFSNKFRKSLKKMKKQRKNLEELFEVVEKLSNKEELDSKYRNHNLINDRYYQNCGECHIRPDWLLIYQYNNDKLLLLLMNTGSHSELFR